LPTTFEHSHHNRFADAAAMPEPLQITKLYTVFDVKDDEAGAIKSFNADAA
jgi:hypothetical protein